MGHVSRHCILVGISSFPFLLLGEGRGIREVQMWGKNCSCSQTKRLLVSHGVLTGSLASADIWTLISWALACPLPAQPSAGVRLAMGNDKGNETVPLS